MPHTHRSIAPAAGTLLLGLFAAHVTTITTAAAESEFSVSPPSLASELDADGWARAQAEPLPDPEKWNWQVLSDRGMPDGSPGAVLRPRPIGPAPDSTFASRTDRKDGGAAVTVGRRLPTDWETKVGVDLGVAADPATTYRLDPPTGTAGSGAAWANLKIPGFNTPLTWDQAQIDARIDPSSEQGRLGTRFSRSLPIGESLSVTLQNGYAVTQSFPTGTVTVPAASEIWSTDRSLRVTLPDSGTSFSAGQSLNSLDEKWLRSLSAEQKMFGGPVSLNGSASETTTGEISKSVTATFRRTW
ncbi:MAG: hypothetical protein JWN71_1484 [Xanthobacteraceae bacterium]|jgi:hypothetical protein|nr:hypothetical protein [Xanthobacteraceae bacterium]